MGRRREMCIIVLLSRQCDTWVRGGPPAGGVRRRRVRLVSSVRQAPDGGGGALPTTPLYRRERACWALKVIPLLPAQRITFPPAAAGWSAAAAAWRDTNWQLQAQVVKTRKAHRL